MEDNDSSIMLSGPLISVVSPEYKGEKMVAQLVERVVAAVSTITANFEIILVNDGSPDNTWIEIERVCSHDKMVKGLNLSRNFGQHYAITAGLAYAKGEWVVVMDCDLQDRPEEIPNLYRKAMEGYDIVYARRVVRQDSFLKKLSSTLFHKVFNQLAGTKTDKTIANFGIYHHQVIEEYNKMPEKARSFGTLLQYLGFRAGYLDVQHAERVEGKSSYTFAKLLKFTFNVVISNTNKPLLMAVSTGMWISLLSFLLALYNVFAKLFGIIQVEGYTTTVFSIWFVGGLLLFMLGVVGLYIDKIYEQVKDRPLFVVMNKLNFD